MDIKAAQEAIKAILAAIPDDALPEFDRVEIGSTWGPCVWWGGTGRHLGSSKRNGERYPIGYRESGAWAAIEHEMAYRADRRLLDNGDDPTGVNLAAKVVHV